MSIRESVIIRSSFFKDLKKSKKVDVMNMLRAFSTLSLLYKIDFLKIVKNAPQGSTFSGEGLNEPKMTKMCTGKDAF